MKKIAIDIRNIGKKRTGSETVVLELTKNILRLDRENYYFLLTDMDDKSVLDYVKKNLELDNKKNVEIVALQNHIQNFLGKNEERTFCDKLVWSVWSLPRWVRKNLPDIYHTEYILPFFLPKSVKLITHIHDVSFKVYRKMISWKDIFFLDIFIPWTIKRADKIIAVSKFTRDEILKYYKVEPKKIEVVYNAVNSGQKTANSEQEKERIKKKYNLPQRYILTVGTMQPRKNIPALVAAYFKIEEKLPDIKLVLMGKRSHNFDAEIDKTVKEYGGKNKRGQVVFTGYVDEEDKADVIQMADLFTAPSLYEGFGLGLLEGMAQSVAVAASDIEPHKEVGGEACVYFNPRSLDETAEKIYTFFMDENMRNELAEKGRKRARFFSWEKSAEKMLKIYKTICKK